MLSQALHRLMRVLRAQCLCGVCPGISAHPGPPSSFCTGPATTPPQPGRQKCREAKQFSQATLWKRDELGLTSKGSSGTQPLFYRCQESLPAENLFSLNSDNFPLVTRDYHRSSQLPSHKATSGLLPWALGLWRGSLGSCLLTEPNTV